MKTTMMASGTAFLKAVEAQYKPEERLFEDPYSEQLLQGAFKFMINIMKSRRGLDYMVKVREKSTPGILGGILCRNRYFDDVVNTAIFEGFDSLVNLGAGYDTRAIRMKGIEKLKVYEIDHPDVIQEKQRRLEKANISVPANLSFVPVDFDHQDLKAEIEKAGFELNSKTLFMMEGVTQYITREAFEGTLRFIVTAAQGSRLAFTYVIQDVFDHPEKYPEHKLLMSQFKMFKLTNMTGYNQSGMDNYLLKFGLKLVEDVGSDYFRTHYLKPKHRDLSLMTIERVVLTEVL